MFQTGFARADVTPPLNTYLSGYYQARYAKDIVTPIELNAIAFSDGENKAVFITADFTGIKRVYCDEIREAISKATGLQTEAIFIASLHQHTSISLVSFKANNVMKDHAYLNLLYRKFSDVAVMALDDLADTTLEISEKELNEKIAFIRRYKLKDGSYKTNPYNVISEIECPAEEPDNKVRLMRFKREGKKDIAFINFQTHADVHGGELFCSDWPGFARENVEKDNPDTYAILACGFEGDSNHINFMGEIRRGPEQSRRMGRVIADAVRDLWNKGKEEKVSKISSNVNIVYNRTNMKGIEHYDECKALYREFPGDTTKTTKSGISYPEAGRIIGLVEGATVCQRIPVSVIKLGDVIFAGLGGEAFVNYGANLRRLFPDRFIFTSCCMNGYEGYLPTKSAFDHPTYEVVTSPFTETVEEDCLTKFKEMI